MDQKVEEELGLIESLTKSLAQDVERLRDRIERTGGMECSPSSRAMTLAEHADSIRSALLRLSNTIDGKPHDAPIYTYSMDHVTAYNWKIGLPHRVELPIAPPDWFWEQTARKNA